MHLGQVRGKVSNNQEIFVFAVHLAEPVLDTPPKDDNMARVSCWNKVPAPNP